MKSYAQRGEDLFLWNALKDVKEGFYIDVGAAHPQADSVTKLFYDLGWSGINIEPGAQYLPLASARPRDINLHIACGAFNGLGKFVWFDGGVGFVADLPEVKEIFERHGHQGHEVPVPQLTLDAILWSWPPPGGAIHFLKIDVEGSELNVLDGLDLREYRPWMIVVEATLPTTEIRCNERWDGLILDADYRCIRFDGLNLFYAANEHPELTA